MAEISDGRIRPLLSWINTILGSVSVKRKIEVGEIELYSASFENLNRVDDC